MDSQWKNDMPDGWLETIPFGDIIDDTFFPLKCPIDYEEVPPDFEFGPKVLKDLVIGKMKINIGLVINLTYTQKYYDEREFKDNIEFKQIPCRGFNEAPQPKEREEFVKVCQTFLARNPHKKIAVHCTHGYNRTGFMICYYLCSIRDWSIDAAISTFANKRPPGIYKQDYINELCNLFGDSDDPFIKAADKPEWELTTASARPDEGTNHGANNLIRPDFYEGLDEIELVRDESLKRRIYRHCCLLCDYQVKSQNVNFPGAQPVSMDRQNINLLRSHRYMVSWKADGCRFMLYIQDEDNIFFLSRSLHLWRVVNLKFPKMEDLNSHMTDTLLDGEMITDIVDDNKIHRYLIYDVISLNGKIVAKENFDKRLFYIRNVIVKARRDAKTANLISPEEPFKVADKGFYYIHHAKKTWTMPLTHERDGLIFQPVEAPYTGGTCPGIMKWKPPSHNSIDFRMVIRHIQQHGCIPESKVFLYVSNRSEPLATFILSKEQSNFHQYNNKIVEMTLQNNRWQIMRERTDKVTPNSFETAKATFASIKFPVTEQILFDFISAIPLEPTR